MAASAASGSAVGSHKQHGAKQQPQAPYNQLKVVTVDKHFLTSNRSSHTSAFSAIAELVDNAKDAKANQCSIQITELEEGAGPTFIMMDTGDGMTPRNLELAFGFGHNIKSADHKDQMIGWAGNGLKSSSMYLGKDLIVFTKTKDTQSIGLLSQTFLEQTGMSEVRVPLVSWDLERNPLQASEAHTEQSMEAITRFSPYTDNEQCLSQLDYIDNTGTIIMIMNLEGYGEQRYQLDWETDERDILIPDTEDAEGQTSAPRTVHNSLRKFLSVLYQDPKMQILIAGHRVRTRRVLAELRDSINYSYRPTERPASWTGSKNVIVEVGFMADPELQHSWSALLYWRKRLIVPFLRFETGHAEADEAGRKAVAIVNCDHLTPTHNKGSFMNPDNHYTKLRNQVHTRLKEFWVARVEVPAEHNRSLLRQGRQPEGFEVTSWVQCCEPFCLKWRRLPVGDSAADPKYEDDWYCYMNPNKKLAALGHDYPQEPDEDAEEERREQEQARRRAQEYMKRKREQSSSSAAAKRRKVEEEKVRKAAEAEEALRRDSARKEAERHIREQARLARLERERKQAEADKLAKQEAQRIEKERIREKARQAKEDAERKLQLKRDKEKREAATLWQREQQQEAERKMKEEADARREAELVAREHEKADAAERRAQKEAAAHAAQELAKAEAAAERERRAQERKHREAGDLAIALAKSQKEAARLARTAANAATTSAAGGAALDTAESAAAEAAAREAEAQRLQQVEAALAQLEGSQASQDEADPDGGAAAGPSQHEDPPLPDQPAAADAAAPATAHASATADSGAQQEASPPSPAPDVAPLDINGALMQALVTSGAPSAAQPARSGSPVASTPLAPEPSLALPRRPAVSERTDANGADGAERAASPDDVLSDAGQEAQQLDGVVQQLRRQWQQATGSTPSTVDKGLARVSAGLASLAKQQQAERQRVVALAARMRVVLMTLSRAAGDKLVAQRIATMSPDELLELDVQAYAGAFVPSPQRSSKVTR